MSRLAFYTYFSSSLILIGGGLILSLIVLAFWGFFRGRRMILRASLLSMGALLLWVCGGFMMSKWENAKGPGKFKIYSRSSQNGTYAKRVFLDQQNRSVKSIYYGRPKMGFLQIWPKSHGFPEKQSTESEYDETGVLRKQRGFDAHKMLRQVLNYEPATASSRYQKYPTAARDSRLG